MEDFAAIEEWVGRAVMLLDLDAFFASVEQLDHPSWRGKPVIVGGSADARGVVSTCSYEARTYGVRSAMPASTAAKLCPHAIWVPGNFARYKEMSGKVMAIMRDESPFMQQVSIDEAFLDITPSRYSPEHPQYIARRIQQRVSELGITCSIGLGVSKSVAKVASDIDKPNGLTVVYPGTEQAFLASLPTKVMSGIGSVAQEKLREYGIKTLGEVAQASTDILEKVFGKNAEMMRARCLGADTDAVESIDGVKSVSNEISFAQDLTDRPEIEAAIATVAAKVGRRLRLKNLKCSGIVLKIRYGNFKVRSTTAKLDKPSNSEYDFIPRLTILLDELWQPGISVRLIGAAAIHLDDEEGMQLELFEESPVEQKLSESVREGLLQATDSVRNRFGEGALRFGREMRTYDNLTGSSSKNPADYK